VLPREIVRKLHRIRIRTNRLVEAGVGGEYHSVFRGRGMEFSEVREYVPGDDVRTIDWNVTARTGVPHVKKFVEERDLTVLLLLDLSASQGFGSQYLTKRELMAEIAALLSFAAVKNNDRVGALLFTDRLERYHAPRKGVDHALAITRDALSLEAGRSGTDLALALRSAAGLLKQRSVVFVLSDFLAAGYEKALKGLQFEVTSVRDAGLAARAPAGGERRRHVVVRELPLDVGLEVLLRHLHFVLEEGLAPLADDEEVVGLRALEELDGVDRSGRTGDAQDDPHRSTAPVTIIAKTTNPRPALMRKKESSMFAALRCSIQRSPPVRNRKGAAYQVRTVVKKSPVRHPNATRWKTADQRRAFPLPKRETKE